MVLICSFVWGDEVIIYLFGSFDIYLCVSFLNRFYIYFIPKYELYDFKLLNSQSQDMMWQMENLTIKTRNANKIGWEVSNESDELCSIAKNWVVSWSNRKYHMINVTYHCPTCQQKPEVNLCVSVKDVHLEWVVGRSSRGK